MSAYRTDEAFAPVPLWLIEASVSDRAIRLYALLSAMRDYSNDELSGLGRAALAKKLNCSTDSLDRAKAELEKARAITVERGHHSTGEIARNVYTIRRVNPAAGSRTRAEEGPRVAASGRHGTSKGNERSSSPARQGRAPTQIGGRKVTAVEEQFALDVLDAFNEVSGRRFGSKEALGKIILRHREHPEVTLEQHRQVIAAQFERPWWKGDPSPAVIYGNGDVFDRALNNVGGNGHNVGHGLEYLDHFGPPA